VTLSLLRLTGLRISWLGLSGPHLAGLLLRLRLGESLLALLLSTLGLMRLRTLIRGTLALDISVLSALVLGALVSRVLRLSASLLGILPGKSLLRLGA